eukprot:361696-Chlamydomonas_euryale.AAC.1
MDRVHDLAMHLSSANKCDVGCLSPAAGWRAGGSQEGVDRRADRQFVCSPLALGWEGGRGGKEGGKEGKRGARKGRQAGGQTGGRMDEVTNCCQHLVPFAYPCAVRLAHDACQALP